jgi:hypothetical protein
MTDECAPGPCGPTAGNCPPTDPYACTLVARLQPAMDRARKLQHTMGLRPYNVFLVWQTRDLLSRTWKEDRRLQLMPVHVPALDDSALLVGADGQYKDGAIALLEISPQQVDEATLRGYRDGKPWAQADADREFFYEVVHLKRCPGDAAAQRHRFTLASAPHHDAEEFQWRVSLVPQLVDREGDGTDVSLRKKPHLKRAVVTT